MAAACKYAAAITLLGQERKTEHICHVPSETIRTSRPRGMDGEQTMADTRDGAEVDLTAGRRKDHAAAPKMVEISLRRALVYMRRKQSARI